MNKVTPSRQYISGFTMIEVMVALLVLSVGLLGLASLQANGLKQNSSAYMRTQATLLANDIADRMRANPTEVVSGGYDNITTPPTSDPGCIASTCTPDQITGHDIYTWYEALKQLPNGTGSITTSGRTFTIRVMWDDNKVNATGTGCDPDNADDMVCFTTIIVP